MEFCFEGGEDANQRSCDRAYVARALETGETRGMMKAVVDAEGEILGFTCLGIEGGEVMSVVQMAMVCFPRFPRTFS